MKLTLFRFLIRWGLPSVLGAFALSAGFLWNAAPDLISGKIPLSEVVLGFLVTICTGACMGAVYSIYRPFLRKLGRHLGDLLTGALTMNLVLLVLYGLTRYIDPTEFQPKDPVSFIGFMTAMGAFCGWVVNITKAETEFRKAIFEEVVDEEED